MSGHFTISAEPKRDLVRIKMSGFFTRDDIERFIAARREAHAQLYCGPNEHLTLNDLTEMRIQSQDMVDAFRTLLADPHYRSRRLAFIIGPTLARSQLFRALDARCARTFDDPWAAEAWLLTGHNAAAA